MASETRLILVVFRSPGAAGLTTFLGKAYYPFSAHFPLKCVRPGVVWFGEPLPLEEWRRAVQASRKAEIFLAIGTSGVVYPAAGLMEFAKEAGARLAVVNAEPTPFDADADWILTGRSGEILPRLL